MRHPSFDELEQRALKRADQRAKKGRPKMKVSGASVKQLAKILSRNAKRK